MGGELADALISRIDKLIADRLDAAISSRLAAASYTAPDNAGIAAIDSLTAARLDVAISSRSTDVGVWAAADRTLTSAPSVIQSIQTGFVVASGVSVSGWEDYMVVDVVITSVAMNKSLVLTFNAYNDPTFPSPSITGHLTSPTNLRISAGYAFPGGSYIRGRWVVVEFV